MAIEQRLLKARKRAYATVCADNRILITGTHMEAEWFINEMASSCGLVIPTQVYAASPEIVPWCANGILVVFNRKFLCISNNTAEETTTFARGGNKFLS